MLSMVLIIPASLQSAANTLGQLMGWGPNSYSVSLTRHYGLHTWAQESFVQLLTDARSGNKPAELSDFPDEVFQDIMDNLIVSVRERHEGHFDDVLIGYNLQRIEESV